MRVLVTGAGGYIGRVVVRQLLGAGHEPIGLVHRTSPGIEGMSCRYGDILDVRSVRAAAAGVDAIVHLAAVAGVRAAYRRPVHYYKVNVGGTVNVLEAAVAGTVGPCRFVLASTAGIYGVVARQPMSESTPADPQNPYAASKLAAEHAVRWQAETGALGAVTLRIGNVAGAVGTHRDVADTRIITRACAVAAGRIAELDVFGDGAAVRDFVHVSDVAQAFVRALDVCRPGRHVAVNIGATAASVSEVIAMAREVTGREIPVSYRPDWNGEVRELRSDTALARRLLDWRPGRSTLRQLVSDQWRAERSRRRDRVRGGRSRYTVTRLAIDGGRPVRSAPMPDWPAYDAEDLGAAREVLASGRVNYWTGEHGRAFEGELAAAVGTEHAVALANGTVALELALRAVGVGPGHEVIVPAATFVATASAVVGRGARPVVVDVDPDTMTMTAATVAPAITARTAAIVVVHLAGHPADVLPLRTLADDHELSLVEDCAQAHGATYHSRPVGALGDIAAWSFCQDKIVSTAGEGGAVTTSDPLLWQRCWEHKDHGKSWAALRERAAPGFRWVHHHFGTNARMTEIQAAVGRNQIRKLPTWREQRNANASVLVEALRDQPAVRVTAPPDRIEHAYYRFYARVRPERLAPGWDRDRVVAALVAEGIPCWHGGCMEIYRERAFRRFPGTPRFLPVAAELGRTCFALPVHPTLSLPDMDDMATALTKVFGEATA